jgi:hypothetical protein
VTGAAGNWQQAAGNGQQGNGHVPRSPSTLSAARSLLPVAGLSSPAIYLCQERLAGSRHGI